jgi:GNAT superfamily N-acetyltransferase
MPKINVRPAIADDIPQLVRLEHNYETDFVWQMDFRPSGDQKQVSTSFRRIRLPRTQRVEYPRAPKSLLVDWTSRSAVLVASMDIGTIGYISLDLNHSPSTCWTTDLVVARPFRRKGVATALVLSALEWGSNHASRQLVLEFQLKNHAGIELAQKFGFDFCGYNDRYFDNNDIAIFFAKPL